ncbi:MAG: retropepsin-like aspartic protease [Parvularculaceae bacterium]
MRRLQLQSGALAIALLVCAFSVDVARAAAGNEDPAEPIDSAWEAWGEGDIAGAEALARKARKEGGDRARHLLAYAAYVGGDYEGFLSKLGEMTPGYAERDKLSRPAVEALKHLDRPQEALEFARAHNAADDWTERSLTQMAAHPLNVTLQRVTIVPFTDDALTPLLPGLKIEINGVETTARLDTGGVFLNMSLATAAKLGVETTACRAAQASLTETRSCLGFAASVKIGDATIENAPVQTAETLTAAALGAEDAVVIGANFLERFLATIDYPQRRIILSPRGEEKLRRAHLKLIGKAAAETPFYLWGDHFMFARGRIGANDGLNFFIDSGLVAVAPSGRQAALLASQAKADEWGAEKTDPDGLFRALSAELALGPLAQTGHLIFVQPQAPVPSLGGVRIDALLSHAFLKKYSWTIDFDQRVFRPKASER